MTATILVRRGLVAVALLAGGALAVGKLGDLFQSRGDPVVRGSRSQVILDVDEHRAKPGFGTGGEQLVAACSGSVFNRVLEDPGVVEIEPGRYRFEVTPSLGRHSRLKLVGCLEDLTLDHLRGNVVSIERVA